MGNQTKIEIENDYVYYRKGSSMSPMDVIHKFCYIASKAIAADPSKNINQKQAKQKLMQLIFENTGLKIVDSGGISTATNGGLKKAVYAKAESGGYEKTEEGGKVKINRVLKMGSSNFDLEKMFKDRDYSSDLHQLLLKQWDLTVPKLSRVTDEDFDRAIQSSKKKKEIDSNHSLRSSLKFSFDGVHRKNNPRATQAQVVEPTKVDLDEARNLI